MKRMHTMPHQGRSSRLSSASGFTLLELMVVVSIVGILATLAVPSYRMSVLKAREAVLHEDLFVMRDMMDKYYADHGQYPANLPELVEKDYLRKLPVDPFTETSDSWVEMYATGAEGDSGVYDVHSGSDRVALNGTSYNEW
jgi:general secretion pathway protein G